MWHAIVSNEYFKKALVAFKPISIINCTSVLEDVIDIHVVYSQVWNIIFKGVQPAVFLLSSISLAYISAYLS